jgi:predicted porin
MKKRMTRLAAAAVLACAGAAHAQSSVTLWGIMDVNVQHFDATGAGHTNALGNGSLSTSQIGFRGVEDLGGGLRAAFWLEGSLNPDTGTGRNSNVNNQPSGAVNAGGGITFDRRSYVGLAGNWGEVRLGHDFVPNHYNSIAFDAFNANGVARAGDFTFAAVNNSSLSSTITASNSISYWLPANLGGVYGMAMVALGENPSSAANHNDGNFRSVRLGYANGPFDVAGAVSHTQYASTTLLGDYTHANLGASYNAGFARFFVLLNEVKVHVVNGPVKKDAWVIGAHVPVGPGRLRFTYGHLNDRSSGNNANGTPRSDNDAMLFGVGYVYEMSKRTALYTTYGRVNNDGQANYLVSGGLTPTAGGHSSGVEAGIRHTF